MLIYSYFCKEDYSTSVSSLTFPIVLLETMPTTKIEKSGQTISQNINDQNTFDVTPFPTGFLNRKEIFTPFHPISTTSVQNKARNSYPESLFCVISLESE